MAKIAYFLKEDFQAYFPYLLPGILTDMQQEIDIKLTSAAEASEGAGVTMKIKGFEGEQRISMNTSALEGKIAAFKLVSTIGENLSAAFLPYCEALIPVVLPGIAYQYSKAIRKFAMKTCVSALKAAGANGPAVLQQALLPAFLRQVAAGVENQDLKGLKTLLKHLWLMFKALNEAEEKNYLNEQHFAVMGPLLGKVLSIVKEAKAATMKSIQGGKKNFDLDEEDLERVKEELAKVCGAATYVMEISGQLVVGFGAQVAATVKNHWLNFFALSLNAYKQLSESELLDATCFFCDFIEYANHGAD